MASDTIVPNVEGRWPANVVLTDPIFDGGVDGVVGGGEAVGFTGFDGRREFPSTPGYSGGLGHVREHPGYGDSGTYSRFFLVPKASRSDREPVWGEELVAGGTGLYDDDGYREPGERKANHTAPNPRKNSHPTVKPVDLMRHLVRLVTPPGGIVLDPFLGSGTTLVACIEEGFSGIGIELDPEYVRIAEARLNGVQMGLAL